MTVPLVNEMISSWIGSASIVIFHVRIGIWPIRTGQARCQYEWQLQHVGSEELGFAPRLGQNQRSDPYVKEFQRSDPCIGEIQV